MKIPWPGHLDPYPRFLFFEIIRNSVMYPRNNQIFSNQIVSKCNCFISSVTVKCSIVCQEYRVGVEIQWPGYLDPTQFYDFEIRNAVICQKRTQIF